MVRPASKASMTTDGEYHMHVVHHSAATQQCEDPFVGRGWGGAGRLPEWEALPDAFGWFVWLTKC